jgi:hypothetical protein
MNLADLRALHRVDDYGQRAPLAVRLLRQAAQDGECWSWTGAVSNTYGRIAAAQRTSYLAHRAAYETFAGPIPDGQQIDHLCRNRICINPAHLEAVTQQVNLARGNGVYAVNARKTHCKRGHEFTSENTLIQQGTRKCRACKRAANAARAAA